MKCQNKVCVNELTDNQYVVKGFILCPQCYAIWLRIAPRCAFCDVPIHHEPYHAHGLNYCDRRCASNWFMVNPKKLQL